MQTEGTGDTQRLRLRGNREGRGGGEEDREREGGRERGRESRDLWWLVPLAGAGDGISSL